MSSHFDLVDFRLFASIAEASSLTAGAIRIDASLARMALEEYGHS